MSRLANLSHIDFEELCRDIAQAETGMRFSAFGPGPDGGADGRHSKGPDTTIIQCKHYLRSSFGDLTKSVAWELPKLKKLKPGRYLLFTSLSLSPDRSDKLASLIGEHLKNPGDIWGQEDIEAALRGRPELEKSHFKLWMSSSAVLDRILHSGLENYTNVTRDDIVSKLRVYVRNESFDRAGEKLEAQKVLIISGPPGVGKTTLADMLAYYYLNEGWRFYAIRTLDEGFVKLNDATPTIFYFDDFLGRIQLDKQTLLQHESALARFVQSIRKSKNARFIMTTRAHIFEEARQYSDYIDDGRFQLSKYLLDVGQYTRKVKSYILFNHLSASNLTTEHFAALLEGDWLKKIIDHRNYNPRAIASASSENLGGMVPSFYPSQLLAALENPDLIWSKPFHALDMRFQNLLVALYFSNEFGTDIDTLRTNYADLHRSICAHHGQSTSPSDFDYSLKSLESGFVSISGRSVSFVNPSLKDFLKSYLVDRAHLQLFPAATRRADWARRFWKHIEEIFKTNQNIMRSFANAFSRFAERIDETPTRRTMKEKPIRTSAVDDLSVSDRVELLLEWWQASKNEFFVERALTVLRSSELELDEWRDGPGLPAVYQLIGLSLPNEHPLKIDLQMEVSSQLEEMIDGGLNAENLVQIHDSFKEHLQEDDIPKVREALEAAIDAEFDYLDQSVGDCLTESDLTDYLTNIELLAARTGRNSDRAEELVMHRLHQLAKRYEAESERTPRFTGTGTVGRSETFGDDQVRSLFTNLLN